MHVTCSIHLAILIISDMHVTRNESPIRQVDIGLWPRVCCKHLTGVVVYLLSVGSFPDLENARRVGPQTDF